MHKGFVFVKSKIETNVNKSCLDATSYLRFPAEWERQSGVMLALPSADTDWAPLLERAHETYANIIKHISRFEKVLLLCQNLPQGKDFLRRYDISAKKIKIVKVPYNDTWTRDYGPLTVFRDKRPVLLDFMFNGWGLKFAADLDNGVTKTIYKYSVFKNGVDLCNGPLVFEGGSVESDGKGTLLVTGKCLLSANRNPSLSKDDIERILIHVFGAKRVLWLTSGELEGDDTDAHIDTLARFAPSDSIVYMSAPLSDRHYASLKKMEGDLKKFRTGEGKPYNLVPLPLPTACFDSEGKRLPATYANYLVINGAVLVPVYNDIKNDAIALKRIADVFSDREVIPVNCRSLIEQHGSLHCVTMQFPEGVLR